MRILRHTMIPDSEPTDRSVLSFPDQSNTKLPMEGLFVLGGTRIKNLKSISGAFSDCATRRRLIGSKLKEY